MNDFDSQIGTALRDRVADVHPDLDRLLTTSVRAGTRIRARRRLGVSLAAAAGVVVVAVGGTQIAGGETRTVDGGVGIAAEPTVPALVAGSVLTAPSGTEIRVEGAAALQQRLQILAPPHASGRFVLLLADGYTRADVAWAKRTYPGQALAAQPVAADPAAGSGRVDAPVEVTAPGWKCEWFLVDDKATCSGPDDKVAGLVIRSAKDYASWSADPDKGAGPGVYTTKPHGDVFISVQSGRGSSDADLESLGRSLRWLD
jgi:hypothetical protein